MANGGTVIVETKKTTLLAVTITLVTVFMMGWLSNGKMKEETVSFSYEEIQMIEVFQEQLEEDLGPKAEVIVYKDKDGNLMLSWKVSKK